MEQNKLTLGSLFDGSGGFPLGGLISGITPVWASEIEPFPIRVTTKRLPFMKHYGDVSKMNGADVEPVDIITFGSPCQDMSIAGKRAGLDGSRSNLFYEAIRIVKEMRCATDGKYPRYIVWENVPGAFSSNKGADFQSVLEEVCSVKGYEIHTPRPEKWPAAGEIVADDFSLAWRVFDAQYWGVPQRRKRIYLVADLAGGSAGKILFESEGVSGYTPQGFRSWQGAAGSSAAGVGATGCVCLNDQGGSRMGVTEDVAGTLRAQTQGHPPCVISSAGFCTEHSATAQGIGYKEETAPTLRAGTVPAAITLENHPTDSRIKISADDTVQTLTSRMGTGGMNVPLVMKIRAGCEGGGKGPLIQKDRSATLSCNNDQTVFVPKTYCMTTGSYTQALEGQAPTLMARDYKAPPVVNAANAEYVVRRLTPTECARLQGFPDWWCDDLGTEEPSVEELQFWAEVFETHRKIIGTSTKPKSRSQIIKWLKNPHSDSAEYKMWGNGVALPNVYFVLSGIVYYAQLSGE